MAAGTTRHHRALGSTHEFFNRAYSCGMSGLASMLAYNMLLAVVPLALLGLFIGGHVLTSHSIQSSVEVDLKDIFPGTTKHTLQSLLDEVSTSTTTTGVLSLLASIWVASSFWGALDTSFGRIYHCGSRAWIHQKRFGVLMVFLVLLMMLATVLVPTLQAVLKAASGDLPIDLRDIREVVYLVSLGASITVLFICLSLIYARVPNCRVSWHGVWPGALAATAGIAIVAYAFPLYLSSVSTIARFGTVVVFVVIVLGWFYVVAMIILSGGVINAMALAHEEAKCAARRGLEAATLPPAGPDSELRAKLAPALQIKLPSRRSRTKPAADSRAESQPKLAPAPPPESQPEPAAAPNPEPDAEIDAPALELSGDHVESHQPQHAE